MALKRFSYKNRIYIKGDPSKGSRSWNLEPRFLEFICANGVFTRNKPSKIENKVSQSYLKTIKRATATIANQVYRKLENDNAGMELTDEIRDFILDSIVNSFNKVRAEGERRESAIEKTREALRRNEDSRD